MYEDSDLWPFKCPKCGEEFTKEIGWLKAHSEVKCPGVLDPVGPIPCPITIRYNAEKLGVDMAEAKAGRLDPFRATWVRK
jgi:hypothetical protein